MDDRQASAVRAREANAREASARAGLVTTREIAGLAGCTVDAARAALRGLVWERTSPSLM